MYSLTDIHRGLSDPDALFREINKLYHTKLRTREYNLDGADVLDSDWDNLLILDACRADVFEQRIQNFDIDGEFDRRTSRGSTSEEFVRANFQNRKLHDLVYISANEFFAQLHEDINSEVHWFENLNVEFENHKSGTVPPAAVTERALELADEYPNKRLIVHFLQPHQPYLGPTGEKFATEPGLVASLRNSAVTDNELQQAYTENLDLVLEHAQTLVDEFTGKTIITADHGEFLGERASPIPIKTYGHFEGLYLDELVDVPWFTCDFNKRKSIVTTDPDGQYIDAVASEEVNERLQRLGYKV